MQEMMQPVRLDRVGAGRTDQRSQLIHGTGVKPVKGQKLFLTDMGNRLLDILPVCVLNKNGAHTDFKRSFSRPPTLRTIMREQLFVDRPKDPELGVG